VSSGPVGTIAPCRAQDLAMDAGTDRTTYRPGDTITVTATLTNEARQPCSLFDLGTPSNANACYPEVLLQRFDATDGYNALLGPYDAVCGQAQSVLNPGDTTAGQVQVKYEPPEACGAAAAAPACQLRSGTWTVVVNWLTQSSGGGETMSAEPVFFCPPDACSPAPSAGTAPSTTATTGPAVSSTSTIDPASTSTTAPAGHKSSTTTTTKPTAKSTTTTTRKASRR
jgi:hypothetical protein